MQDFDPNLQLEGVLLNKVGGPAHLAWLQEAISGADVDVRVFSLPKVRSKDSAAPNKRCQRLQASCCLGLRASSVQHPAPQGLPVGALGTVRH